MIGGQYALASLPTVLLHKEGVQETRLRLTTKNAGSLFSKKLQPVKTSYRVRNCRSLLHQFGLTAAALTRWFQVSELWCGD